MWYLIQLEFTLHPWVNLNSNCFSEKSYSLLLALQVDIITLPDWLTPISKTIGKQIVNHQIYHKNGADDMPSDDIPTGYIWLIMKVHYNKRLTGEAGDPVRLLTGSWLTLSCQRFFLKIPGLLWVSNFFK